MKRVFVAVLTIVGLLLVSTAALKAEVKTEEKSQVKFAGMMGRMMGMFGGKAAREGIINTVAVKGNRMMTVNETTGEIIDLDEQKVYTLDMKKKTYEVLTFEEMRKRMQEAQEKAAKAVKQEQPKKDESAPQKEMEVDFSLKESGQKKTINGYDCREVLMTITTHEKGKTLEEAGGMVMTSHIWLAPAIPELKEIAEFQRRYSEALQGPLGLAGAAEQMAMALAMYPAMKDMMGKMETEKVNMEGAQILTEMVMETAMTSEQAAQQRSQDRQQEQESPGISSMGGIGGLLGRKLSRKKEEKPEAPPPNSPPSNRATIMTTTHELLKVSTSVPAADLSIPAGFKEKK
jgi:hypothetical protein